MSFSTLQWANEGSGKFCNWSHAGPELSFEPWPASLPLIPVLNAACFLCSPAGQPIGLRCSLLPHCKGPGGLWDQLGLEGPGDSSVSTSLLRGTGGGRLGTE